jgi:hypothetical protein
LSVNTNSAVVDWPWQEIQSWVWRALSVIKLSL